jgi:hypothetical protein
VEENKKEAIKLAVTLTEKEIVFFAGKKRSLARKKYRANLRLCEKTCLFDEPLHLESSYHS